MELFQLKYFAAVVREGAISAAARSLHVSQPSLSVQMNLLEAELNTKLLERSSRGITPTAAGRRLYLSCRRMQREIDDVHREIAAHEFGTDLPIRLGVQPMIAAGLLPMALSRTIKKDTSVYFLVKERNSATLPDLIQHRDVDAGIMALTTALPRGFRYRPLMLMRYAVFTPIHHDLAEHATLTINQLLPHPLVVFNDAFDLPARIAQCASLAQQNARIVFTSDQALTVLQMAVCDLGLAILPNFMSRLPSARKLKCIPLTDDGFSSQIVAAWMDDQTMHPLIEKLFDVLTEADH